MLEIMARLFRFARSFLIILITTILRERIGHWIGMRRTVGRYDQPNRDGLWSFLRSTDSIITTFPSQHEFSGPTVVEQ